MDVIKRDNTIVSFDKKKIREAVIKAMKNGSGIYLPDIAKLIANDSEKHFLNEEQITIFKIEQYVYDRLVHYGQLLTAKSYEGYRAVQEFKRNSNTTDDSILELLNRNNEDVMMENSNKNASLNATQRDLIAGEVSKDISRRKLIPTHLVQAHDEGIIHWHDMDYTLSPMFNCFDKTTKFISDMGTISFEDAGENTVLMVPTHTGEWKKAVVKKYEKQKLYRKVFKRQNNQVKEIICTNDHRWILKDNSITTELKINDKLVQTPIIEKFNFNNCNENEKLAWCIGFVIGDGHDYYDNDNNFGSKVRLCNKKEKYAERFIDCGFTTNRIQSYNNEFNITLPGISKQKFLNDKTWKQYTLNEKIALINGLYAADGEIRNEQYPTGISTSDERIMSMISELSELAGFYLGKNNKHNKPTNFSNNRKDTYHFRFNRKQYRANWTLISQEFVSEDECWCLEVEDNHSFILSGGIVTGNCCLVNLEDMFTNGTVINEKLVEEPKSFGTACTVATQIIAQVSSNQYGGQSITIKHLAKYLKISEEKALNHYLEMEIEPKKAKQLALEAKKKELKDGIQTIRYQLSTLQTTNGQAPFSTIYLEIEEGHPYEEEMAMICEEMIKQRLEGMKNFKGQEIGEAFPKLVYLLDEHNCLEGGKYDYITKLCAKCNAKRLVPDYQSAKIMRMNYEGNTFPPMGE